MRAILLLATAALATGPLAAQSMAGMQMPGMAMPASPAKPHAATPLKKKAASARKPVAAPPHRHQAHDAMGGMDMAAPQPSPGADSAPADQAMPGMTMPGAQAAQPGHDMQHDMAAMPGMAPSPAAAGTDLPPGDAPPPPVRHDRSADAFYGAPAMAEAEARMMGAHGGSTYHQILFNLAEYQAQRGRNAYRWSGEAWIGGDLDRLVVKSEGEGAFGRSVESADVQALYSRAIDPYWNLQAGLRQAFLPGPNRPYAVLAIEGLAPYWVETEASLFLSSKGDLLARAEAYHDQRITEQLVLQPRAELNFAAQTVRANRIGAGLSDAELGLRLRYEFAREFAPYVGLSWERRVGRTARLERDAGEKAGGIRFVTGLRFWF